MGLTDYARRAAHGGQGSVQGGEPLGANPGKEPLIEPTRAPVDASRVRGADLVANGGGEAGRSEDPDALIDRIRNAINFVYGAQENWIRATTDAIGMPVPAPSPPWWEAALTSAMFTVIGLLTDGVSELLMGSIESVAAHEVESAIGFASEAGAHAAPGAVERGLGRAAEKAVGFGPDLVADGMKDGVKEGLGGGGHESGPEVDGGAQEDDGLAPPETMADLLSRYAARCGTAAMNDRRKALNGFGDAVKDLRRQPAARLRELEHEVLAQQGPVQRARAHAVMLGWMELNARMSVGDSAKEGLLMPALDTAAGLNAWFKANPGFVDVHITLPETVNGVVGMETPRIVMHAEPRVVEALRRSDLTLGEIHAVRRIYVGEQSMSPSCVIRPDGGIEIIGNGVGFEPLAWIAAGHPMTPADQRAMGDADGVTPEGQAALDPVPWYEHHEGPRQPSPNERRAQSKIHAAIDLAAAYRGARMVADALGAHTMANATRGGE